MTVVLQQGINGVVLGSLYVLVALGLTLIYGVLVQINFAHADIVTPDLHGVEAQPLRPKQRQRIDPIRTPATGTIRMPRSAPSDSRGW